MTKSEALQLITNTEEKYKDNPEHITNMKNRVEAAYAMVDSNPTKDFYVNITQHSNGEINLISIKGVM